jgi:hypothetical protein
MAALVFRLLVTHPNAEPRSRFHSPEPFKILNVSSNLPYRRAGNLQEAGRGQAQDREAQERERNAGTTTRQRAIDTYVAEFESTVGQTLQRLGDASGEMRKTSTGLSTVSRQTNSRVEVAQKASGKIMPK